MNIFIVGLMVVSHTLAAPGINKRDVEYYGYLEIPAPYEGKIETTTHYCPEEDIPAKFIPNPPEIQNFPLPDFQVVPGFKQAPSQEYGPPVKQYQAPFEEYGPPPVKQYEPVVEEHEAPAEEYGPPAAEYGPPAAEYGPPAAEYGPPAYDEDSGAPLETYVVPSTEAPTTPAPATVIYVEKHVEAPKHHKFSFIKHHLNKLKNFQPRIVLYKKKIEFPGIKKLFTFNH